MVFLMCVGISNGFAALYVVNFVRYRNAKDVYFFHGSSFQGLISNFMASKKRKKKHIQQTTDTDLLKDLRLI